MTRSQQLEVENAALQKQLATAKALVGELSARLNGEDLLSPLYSLSQTILALEQHNHDISSDTTT